MKIPTTREIMDLQMLVEGYRNQAVTFEKALDAANYRLKFEETVSNSLAAKVERLSRRVHDLEQELLDRDRLNGYEVA